MQLNLSGIPIAIANVFRTWQNKGIGTDNLTNGAVTEDKVSTTLLNTIYDRQYPVGWTQLWAWTDLPVLGFWDNRGWIRSGSGTIGDASSGATIFDDADAKDLFVKIWTNYTDVTAPIFTSTGEASTRGETAAADWTAHKRITLVPADSNYIIRY